jgi:hypothetical protein
MKNNLIIAVILTALVVGTTSFWGGMKYQKSKTPNFQEMRGQLGPRTRNQVLRPITGEILSQDDQSLTVKLADNSSKIILLSENSTINKTEAGTKEDLKQGVKITVFGQENSDGSLTAQNIQIGSDLFRLPQENTQ